MNTMKLLLDYLSKQDAIKNVKEQNKWHPEFIVPYPRTKAQIEDCAYNFDYYLEEMLDHDGKENYISYSQYVKWSLSSSK